MPKNKKQQQLSVLSDLEQLSYLTNYCVFLFSCSRYAYAVQSKGKETRDKVIAFRILFVLVLFSFLESNHTIAKNKQSFSHNITVIAQTAIVRELT